MSLGSLEKLKGRLSLAVQKGKMALGQHRPALYYVAPDVEWSTDWDGRYITQGVQQQFGLKAQLISNPRWLAGQIVHYGSLWDYLGSLAGDQNARNKVVVTVFHGDRGDENPAFGEGIDQLLGDQDEIAKLVTSNQIMGERFRGWGFPLDKVVTIPLGVDLDVFRPWPQLEREARRKELGIPPDAFCIGSFQKDGVGWEEGLEPKPVKGPDVFLDVVAELAKANNLHVLLSAPARGFVKRGLERIGVSYTHKVLAHYPDLAPMYAALDAYLITSREEGGPKGIVEAMASGVPIVSTRVGMAPDVIEDGANGLLADIDDVISLVSQAKRLLADKSLREQLAAEGIKRVADYDWRLIAAQYYEQVYAPLLAREPRSL